MHFDEFRTAPAFIVNTIVCRIDLLALTRQEAECELQGVALQSPPEVALRVTLRVVLSVRLRVAVRGVGAWTSRQMTLVAPLGSWSLPTTSCPSIPITGELRNRRREVAGFIHFLFCIL